MTEGRTEAQTQVQRGSRASAGRGLRVGQPSGGFGGDHIHLLSIQVRTLRFFMANAELERREGGEKERREQEGGGREVRKAGI